MKNQSISVKYGLGIGVLLILVFLLLTIFNLHLKPYVSAINLIIVGVGLFFAIKSYKQHSKNNALKKFTYGSGFGVGVASGFISTIIFTIFFAIYASNIEPGFVDKMMGSFDVGYKVGVGTVSFIVALMGLATTVVMSLAVMQLMKDSWNTKKNR